jgi:hypothetical protein
MPKKAVSVTLEQDNLLWLRGRAAVLGHRSLSDALDTIVTDARLAGRVPADSIRSVAGTVDISAADPGLDLADAALRTLFDESLRRPLLVRDSRPGYAARKSPRARRRRG